jgi:L-amino acid N-acyltransferase YncA
MNIETRPARPEDAPAMCALLNEIIAVGGTTAYQTPFDVARMTADYIAKKNLIATTVAHDGKALVGFQALSWPEPDNAGADRLPPDWAYIATFVKGGITGRGIGKALFAVTRPAARAAGATAIDATIRADNAGGLRYYSAIGFEDYAVLRAMPLSDGTLLDRIRKRITP